METKTKRPTKVQKRILTRMLHEGLLIGWAGTMTTPSLRRLVSKSDGQLKFDWPCTPDGYDGCALGYNEIRWNSYCALTDSPWVERLPEDLTERLFREIIAPDGVNGIRNNETPLVRYDGFGSRPTLYRLTAAGRREID